MLFPFKPNYRVRLVSFISILLYCFWKQKREFGKAMKKICGKRYFLENSLHNRRFKSQVRRRLLPGFRAECGMLLSTHLAFIKRLLCRLLEKKRKKSGNVGSGTLLFIPCFNNCDENHSLLVFMTPPRRSA